MRKTLTLTSAVCLFLTPLAPAAPGPLDGTAWKVQVVPTSETAEKGIESFEDLLTFANGRLTSRELSGKGIEPAEYSADGTKDFLNWKSVPLARERNAAQWTGTIREKEMKGTLEWLTADGRKLYFFINGERQ